MAVRAPSRFARGAGEAPRRSPGIGLTLVNIGYAALVSFGAVAILAGGAHFISTRARGDSRAL